MRQGYYWVILLCCLVVLLPVSSEALDPGKSISQYNLDSWNTEDGLPQNSVNRIIQTQDGYLWVATQEGLARFDGIRFTVYDKKTTRAITNNHINDICQTHDGSMWIGTLSGLIRMEKGIFSVVRDIPALVNADITCFFEDSRGSLWIGTGSKGLVLYSNRRFSNIPIVNPDSGQGSSYPVQSVTEDNQGRIWIGTASKGLSRYENDSLLPVSNHRGETEYSVRSLYCGRQGNIWVGTAEDGLYCYKEGNWTHREGILNEVITSIVEDRDGSIWIGSFGGLNRLIHEKVESFTKKQGFQYDQVLSLFEDHEGNLWIGTSGGGLSRLKDGKFMTYTETSGLSYNDIFSIFEDKNGLIWIGTSGGGVNCITPDGIDVYTIEDGLADNRVFSVYGDRNGTIWVGTNNGLNVISDGTIKRVWKKDILTDLPVLAIYQDSKGVMWFGSEGEGLVSLEDGLFTSHNGSDGVSSSVVNGVIEDKRGAIWVGTNGSGLDRFFQGVWQNFTVKDGLGDDTIMALYVDSLNNLWIGTYGGGLSLFRNGSIKTFTTREGLFDDVVFQILEDDEGRLWISCNKGVYSISKRDLLSYSPERSPPLTYVSYGTMDGMKSSECNGGVQPAGWKSRDGKLWFPTLQGVAVIDPANIRRNLEPPRVVIEKINADGRLVSSTREFSLPPGKENFEFHYTGLSYYAPAQVMFKYKLEGFDRDWVEVGNRRVAYYTNIPPGNYRFVVKARNSDGVWNEVGAATQFYLAPLFYQTFSFYALCVFLFLASMAGAYRRRIKIMEARHRELEGLVNEQTQELNEQTQELTDYSEKLQFAVKKLDLLSKSDGLTGISNRRHFDERFEEEWRRSLRLKFPLSLIMIDIDSFKLFNDTYGHQKGDECLKQVASSLDAVIFRPGDLVARYGGEEFVIILFNTNLGGASQLAEKLRAMIENLNIVHKNSPINDHVTISLGVATLCPMIAMSPSELIQRADAALYLAKSQGKNCVARAEDDDV